jgi:hypothetical protein
MKTIFRMAIMLGMLLFIPCLYSSGQVSVTPDSTPPHPSSMFEVKATDKGMLIPRMSLAQRLAIGTPAIGLMVYQINGVSGFYYYNGSNWDRIGKNAGHYVGELYGGGVVLWADYVGEHGLICSMVDLNNSQVWSNITNVMIGNTAQSDWDGLGNTMAIVSQYQHESSAAQLCLNYVNVNYGTGTYDDWYLPSIAELIHLFNNIYEVQKTLDNDGNPATTHVTNNFYWSSTELDNISVWGCGLQSGIGGLIGFMPSTKEKNISSYVRAVRAF